MRRLTARALGTLAWLPLLPLLDGCTPTPQTAIETPLAVEASYRLLFNDALVGNAFFVLRIRPDRSYRLEAYTTPAGKMQQAAGHEILEVSRGVVDDAQVRPRRFDHSVMRDDEVQVINLVFDWDSRTLHLVGGEQVRKVTLLPGTQDRLSYLLAARRLAARGEGRLKLQIASAYSTDETLLEVTGEGPLEIPAGRYRAVGLRRVTPDSEETRTLWFDSAASPLPLRVLHSREGNTVDMLLESLKVLDGPDQPPAE